MTEFEMQITAGCTADIVEGSPELLAASTDEGQVTICDVTRQDCSLRYQGGDSIECARLALAACALRATEN